MRQTNSCEVSHRPKFSNPSPWPKQENPKESIRKTIVIALTRLALALAFVSFFAAASWVHAQTLTTLYSFTGQADGADPLGDLIMDSQGNLYGMTALGGNFTNCSPNSCGVIYEISPSGQETILYSFVGGVDGGEPSGGLTMDARGNLYGTTPSFGKNSWGVAFEFVRSTSTFRLLYTFGGKPDGGEPEGRLLRDGQGNLYGVTAEGGTRNRGTVYKLTSAGVETILHNFVQSADGALPNAGLIRDSKGNFYGTTILGGTYSIGTVYKLGPAGGESVVATFHGVDGQNPYGGLVRSATGYLYGTTEVGGGAGLGTVFAVTPTGVESPVYNFSGADGEYPFSDLVMDAQGNLYGTTSGGGAFGHGTVFKVTPTGTLTTLYSFTGGNDGKSPIGGLLMDAQGNLYGTSGGGAFNSGTVFKLTP
jgi:uncharacterized repeat protein (TIGR03803 family)